LTCELVPVFVNQVIVAPVDVKLPTLTVLITGRVSPPEFDTVTPTEELAVRFPSKSRATATIECVPLLDVVVSHDIEYGEVVTSAARFAPSNWNCTPAMPALLDAVAVTLTLAETVAPDVGAVTKTVVGGVGLAKFGGVELAKRGTIPHIGTLLNPLF